MELPIQMAEQVHRIMREELPELPDPDVHRTAAKIVRLVGLYSDLFFHAACDALTGSKTSDDELNALVDQHFSMVDEKKAGEQ